MARDAALRPGGSPPLGPGPGRAPLAARHRGGAPPRAPPRSGLGEPVRGGRERAARPGAPPAGRARADRDGGDPPPGRPGRLSLEPGRLPPRLRVLRHRHPRLPRQPHGGGDPRAARLGAARGRPAADGHRLHGHGRAVPQLRGGDRGSQGAAVGAGAPDLAAEDRHLHRGRGARHPPLHARGPPLPALLLHRLRHPREAAPAHAHRGGPPAPRAGGGHPRAPAVAPPEPLGHAGGGGDPGRDHGEEDVDALGRAFAGIPCIVDVIPYNTAAGRFRAPSWEEVARFTASLRRLGMPVKVRYSSGKKHGGGCGQLAGGLLEAGDPEGHLLAPPGIFSDLRR